MEYKEKEILLKNGLTCTFKNLNGENAKEMIEFLKTISEETSYMLQYQDEINLSIEEEEIFLEQEKQDEKRILIAAFLENELVGTVEVTAVLDCYKLSHRGELGIVIKERYWNLGIGSNMISEAIDYAKKLRFEQIELEVAQENERAVALYKKWGFTCYGLRENSLRHRDGTYSNEVLLVKKIE